jgi:hypothetical protein
MMPTMGVPVPSDCQRVGMIQDCVLSSKTPKSFLNWSMPRTPDQKLMS